MMVTRAFPTLVYVVVLTVLVRCGDRFTGPPEPGQIVLEVTFPHETTSAGKSAEALIVERMVVRVSRDGDLALQSFDLELQGGRWRGEIEVEPSLYLIELEAYMLEQMRWWGSTSVAVEANQVATATVQLIPIPAHEMVPVSTGSFTMGSNSGDSDEQPTHTVHLTGFRIDRYEVTNQHYQVFLQVTGRAQPQFATDSQFNSSQQPVVGVTYFDATGYCKWAGLRLPTEAEWERAARGTDGRTYPWGESIDGSWANYDSRVGKTTPVGSYPAGVSPYGGHDMAGNVREWVADWYGLYSGATVQNPKGAPPYIGNSPEWLATFVGRGGGWRDSMGDIRSAKRFTPWWSGADDLGFRCARDD
jgi:formylglycine-generating enzyme required for sulfatase activity